ncbi:MAG: sulfite exporter TauE/SafE family protein [Solirubrobacterales bacterium]|nr:sulfite exporter TauE/SafE family protein [Solirubrobacterales bacterium]MBV9714233.1 sulfite exporter TauE/SafE family protein [Solirubrobacterales bacterium]
MTLALAGLGALAAAYVQAATGLGFALVLTPVMLALLSPAAAIVTVTALGLELNLLVLVGERRRPRVAWRDLGPILAAAAPGTVCGVILLRALSKPVLQLAVGVALIIAAGALLRARAGAPGRAGGSLRARLAVGFTTGALTTATGVSGPPLALWFARRRLAPAEVRDSLSATFLAIGVIGFAALVPVMSRAHLSAPLLAAGIACVIGGHAVGRRAFARLDPRRFQPLMLGIIACAGAASIVAGAAGL